MTITSAKPTPATQHYWDAAAAHRLELQREVASGRFFFYPRPFSPYDPAQDVEWAKVSGKATLHSYIINHRPAPGVEVISPIIAFAKLAEGPILLTNIVDIDPDPELLTLDMPLEVRFRTHGDMTYPVFAPEKGAGS